jgi:hypothetical protein
LTIPEIGGSQQTDKGDEQRARKEDDGIATWGRQAGGRFERNFPLKVSSGVTSPRPTPHLFSEVPATALPEA